MTTKHRALIVPPSRQKQILNIVHRNYWRLISSLCQKYKNYFVRYHDIDDVIHDTYMSVCKNFFYQYNFYKVKEVPIVIACIIQQLHSRFIRPAQIIKNNFDNNISSLDDGDTGFDRLNLSYPPSLESQVIVKSCAELIVDFVVAFRPLSFHVRVKNVILFLKYHVLSSLHSRKDRTLEAVVNSLSDLEPKNRLRLYRDFYCSEKDVKYVPRFFHTACDSFLVQLRKKIYLSGILDKIAD